MNKWLLHVSFITILFPLRLISSATTEYARQTGMQCKECHVDSIGRGQLTKEGEKFLILLSIKIFLFLIMASTAFIVTFFIGPKLKRKLKMQWERDISKGKHDLTMEDLHSFDGKEGRPAFIAYKGRIYDVTRSKLWRGRDGSHAKKHLAAHDLTNALKTAPHGEDKIFPLPAVGKLIEEGAKIQRPLPERIFYALAYINLGFVFLITLITALWRWW